MASFKTKLFLAIGTALTIWFFIYGVIKPIQSNYFLYKALQATQPEQALPDFYKAATSSILGRQQAVEQGAKHLIALLAQARPLARPGEMIEQNIVLLEQAIKDHPYHLKNYLLLIQLYQGAAGQGQYLEKAQPVLQQARKLSPSNPEIILGLAANYMLQSDLVAARAEIDKVLKIDQAMAKAYWYLGLNYYFAQEYGLSSQAMQKAQQLGYDWLNKKDIDVLADIFTRAGQGGLAEQVYLEAVKHFPDQVQFHASLAALYYQQGKIELARQTARQILLTAPELREQVEAFLQTLE